MTSDLQGFYKDPITGRYFRTMPHQSTRFVKDAEKAIREQIDALNKIPVQLTVAHGKLHSVKTMKLTEAISCREKGLTTSVNFNSEFLKLKLRQMKPAKSTKLGTSRVALSKCQYINGHKGELIGAWTVQEDSSTVIKELSFDYAQYCSEGDSDIVKSILKIKPIVCTVLPRHSVSDICAADVDADLRFVIYVANAFSENSNFANFMPRKCMWTLPPSEMGRMNAYTLHMEFQDALWSCAWNKHTKTLAVGSETSCYLYGHLENSQNDLTKVKLSSGNPYSLEFTPNGNTLYCGLNKGNLIAVDMRTPQKRPTLSIGLGRGLVNIKLLSDESTLITSGYDGKLLNVDLRMKKVVFNYPLHSNIFRKLPFSCDEASNLLCSTGQDHVTRVWNLNQGTLLFSQVPPVENSNGQLYSWFLSKGRKMYLNIFQNDSLYTYEPQYD